MENAIDYRDWKQEIIDGKIYYMAPPSAKHNRIMRNLDFAFMKYFQHNKKKCASFMELGVYLDKNNPNQYFVPDISIICNLNIEEVEELDTFTGIPTLIVEILSSNADNDKVRKFKKYAKFGVKEYWIIDPKSNNIDQFILQGSMYVPINTYRLLDDKEYDKLSPIEKEEYQTSITPTMFSDLSIDLTSIFGFYYGN
ncbi:MAG: hypothetical protein ATN35_02335 [Epulopiscium sp. Nele67-Bin004]|nr:MAG: hypothetical protein ATN35_02335 [Epulopiscium sp. Nele67-Bin004]